MADEKDILFTSRSTNTKSIIKKCRTYGSTSRGTSNSKSVQKTKLHKVRQSDTLVSLAIKYETSMLLPLLASIVIGFLLLRLLIVELRVFGYLDNVFPKCVQLKTMIVAGSGGHTTEVLRLTGSLGKHYSPRLYVVASTDSMSPEKIRICELNSEDFAIHTIPRSREVLQSYLTSVLTTLRSAAYCFPLVAWHRPDLILCNGPGTCIPVCAAAFLYRLLLLKDCRIVFVESICRVYSLSLSGRILYYFADHVIVQWPELLERFPRARYLGRII